MRIISHDVEGFIKPPNRRWKIFRKVRRFFRYRGIQYLGIWQEKQIKNEYKPDIYFIQNIFFKGKRKVPQIDLFRSELLENINVLTPYTQYEEKRFFGLLPNRVYSIGAFTPYPTRAVQMTKESSMLETSVDDLSIISFNLSKKKKHRREQLRFLEGYINHNIHRKFIVIGAFNIKRDSELFSLTKHCSLYKAPLSATYPVKKPKHHTSMILYDNSIMVSASRTIQDSCSNHLPVVLDFEIRKELR
jgi:hypothetical protein